MKTSKFTDSQKAFIIRQGEEGVPVREHVGERLSSGQLPLQVMRRLGIADKLR